MHSTTYSATIQLFPIDSVLANSTSGGCVDYSEKLKTDILPAYQENGIGVMAHSVLAKGLLGGRYKPGHIFEKSDERSTWPAFQGDSLQKTWAVTEQLKTWAQDHGRDLVQLAIAWPVSHPAVYTSIVGARNVQDIPQLAEAGSWTLSLKDLQEIDDIQGDHRLFIDDQPAGKTSDE